MCGLTSTNPNDYHRQLRHFVENREFVDDLIDAATGNEDELDAFIDDNSDMSDVDDEEDDEDDEDEEMADNETENEAEKDTEDEDEDEDEGDN